MPLLGSSFYYAVWYLCPVLWGHLCLSGTADDHRYLMNGKDHSASNSTNYLKPHFFSFCFMMPWCCKQHTQRIIYFLVQVVPSYIHLISAHQKNLLITGVIRHEKRPLRYHVSPLMVLKFLGDALTVIRNYQIT